MKNNYSSRGLTAAMAFVIMTIFVSCTGTKKFVKLEPSDVAALVSNHTFFFIADKMNPMRGPQKNLSSYYDVKVNKDSLASFLPYYGRAYGGIIDPTRGGLEFTSTEFDYTINQAKNKSWEVNIRPKDVQQVQQLSFIIFDNGNATLNVTSTNKDPISFYGHLQPLDQ